MPSSSIVRTARRWDGFDAYLFDIDGTLLQCRDAVHYFAFCEVLTSVAGRPMTLDGVMAHGNTDPGILRDALIRAGVPEESWRPRLPEMLEEIRKRIQVRHTELCVEVLPGVRSVLDHLHASGALMGVATGNLRAVSELKLQRARLRDRFDFGGWSDLCEHRHDVFASAIKAARALAGQHASVCIVGDTPADILAAHRSGVPIIAVATGIFCRNDLLAGNPNLCVDSLDQLIGSSYLVPE